MDLSIPAGATSKIILIRVYDSSSTVGALLAGLVHNTASLTAYYNREGASGAATAISLVTATKGTWTSSGFIAVDGTNMPGWYELHVPDAALAAGAKSVAIHLKGAANMVPVPILIELTATSNQDAVRGGMTALPNAAAEAAGGLYTRGTGAGQIAQDANGNIRANVDTIKTQAVTCPAGVAVNPFVGNATAAISVDANGRLDIIKIAGTTQTARDIGASVLLAANQDVRNVSGTLPAVVIARPTGAVVADAGNSTTTFKTNLASAEDNYIKDAYIKFTSGDNINQVKRVSAYNGTTKFVTAGAFTDIPAAADVFVIINE